MKKTNLNASNIGELQKQAADALNSLFACIVEGNYRVALWPEFLGLAFRIEIDDEAGYKFIPNDIAGKDYLKYKAPELDNTDDGGGFAHKPSPPTFKDIASPGNKAKTVSRGVRK